MNKIIATLFTTLFYLSVANASFINLDFESGHVQAIDDYYGILDWNVAVPGWNQSQGEAGLYYGGFSHVGVIQLFHFNEIDDEDEYYDSYQEPSIHRGNYSLSFTSGFESSNSEDAPWIDAFISQVGKLPADAKYIQLLAEGVLPFEGAETKEVMFEVSLGGEIISMNSLGNGLYRGDVSDFSGSTVELKITNTWVYELAIDNIAFSPVPLPASMYFFISSLLGLSVLRKNMVV